MKRTLIVMAKAPEAGRVKTRLGKAVGMGRAAHIFRILLRDTLAEALSSHWTTLIAVEPRIRLRAWRHVWPASARVVAQSPGDLGVRLLAAMREAALAAPGGRIVIIGADAPALRRRHIAQAFRALGRADAVFGPAEDGGFWLIGLAGRARAPDLFRAVRWSGPHALADVIEGLPPGFRIAFLEQLPDVDEAADLGAMGPHSRRSGR